MRILPIVLALTAAGSTAAAQQGRQFSWHGHLVSGQTLDIRGVNGGITVGPASGDEIEVTADKHARRSDPASVQVKVVPYQGGVTICALYPTPPGRPENECLPGGRGRSSTHDNDVVVDFNVKLPAGVKLNATTVNGAVEATGLRADADARTVNGSVRIETTGLASATTVNGSVNATLGRADWDGTLEFSTVNGGIHLTLPAGVSTVVRAETVNGDISTDFPLTIQGRFSHRRLRGTIGNGGRELRLSTVNGAIELRRR